MKILSAEYVGFDCPWTKFKAKVDLEDSKIPVEVEINLEGQIELNDLQADQILDKIISHNGNLILHIYKERTMNQ